MAMLMAAQDLRLDLQAWKQCAADAKRLCPDVVAHRGRIQVRAVAALSVAIILYKHTTFTCEEMGG